MNVKETLYQRLKILQKGGAITQEVADYSSMVVELLIDQKPDADDDKAVMFITHLAMAGQRILDGKEEAPLDKKILEAVRQEPVYGEALEFLRIMLSRTELNFPDTEKEFLAVHLCNLFTQ